MAKKQTPDKPEEPAEELTTNPNQPEPARIDWPESTETRELQVELTAEEVAGEADRLVNQLAELGELTASKSAAAKRFGAMIEEKEKEITQTSDTIKSRSLRREVACHWVFEANGINDLGNPNHHSGMKTLVRDDTGAVVEVIPITGDDRQMILPISDEEQHGANLAKLKALGYTVEETPDDIEHDGSFQAVNADSGHTLPIYADNLADAAAQAVAELSKEPEPAAA